MQASPSQLSLDTGPRVLVALDFADTDACLDLVKQLRPEAVRLKVGKELFASGGPALVSRLIDSGFDVFLDLKYHDIPNTVAKAVVVTARLGVWMVNVHASGGRAMMEAARSALAGFTRPPLLIGVTVLTSLSEAELREVGVPDTPDNQVLRLAGLAQDCGLDGVVCSAREAQSLKARFGPDFRLVTPGIRPAGSSSDDQQRIMTPADALAAGSDYLVIGRPITAAPDPAAVCAEILASL